MQFGTTTDAQPPERPRELRDRYGFDMEFRVLGPLEHGPTDDPTSLGGPKQRAVLAMLVSRVGEVVPADVLLTGVWGADAPPSLKASLHTYISNLRIALDGGIARVGNGYQLEADPRAVDASVFTVAVDEARASMSAQPAQASEALRQALALWRGRPYADLAGVPGLAAEIRRLDDLRLVAVECRLDADIALGRHAAVVAELETLAAEYPLREGFRFKHMIALYRDGRQAEALRAYQQTREYLVTELGVDPNPELQKLEQRILEHDPTLLGTSDTRTEQIAFLFTDVQGSTALWETKPDAMRDALSIHDAILTGAVHDAGGRVFKHTGDGVLAAFHAVTEAAAAAERIQRELPARDWGDIGPLRVRMAIDVGEVDVRGGDYFGPPLNRGSRLMNAAHGGQVVMSKPAHDALRTKAGVQIRNLGEYRLRGLGAPQEVFQLLMPGLDGEFPELSTDASIGDGPRQFGDSIRGYELRERIGVGRFGVVYRAYQPSVGREVAVKVIRPEYANHPMFVRRFEAEARLVAKLSHPHIVPLYDFWRDTEGAYLVMPYLEGRSLAGSRYGALPLARAAAILRQIGAALSYAHRQGVIHRDVKPANILIDGDGNAYLGDFGIAVRAVERATGGASTSQDYRAPEDNGGGVDERADVYSLAAVTVELLTGTPPTDIDLSVLPAGVREVLRRGLDRDPQHRHQSIDEFVSELVASAGSADVDVRPVIVRNPYKGLAAFDETDARDFFGRTEEIDELCELLTRHQFVTVVGPSGSGKSSLVRAGLVPVLRSGRLPGSSDWLTVTMVPGAHPFDELATALGGIASHSLGELAAELRTDTHGLLRVAKRLTQDFDTDLLVVVDQFEELFSLVSDDTAREQFIESLLEATGDPHGRLRIVATIRADFFDHPLSLDSLGKAVASAHLAVAIPGPDQLLEAIEGPAEGAGLVLEAGLAHRIAADVRDQPGALPLMEFVLTDLADHADGGRMTWRRYEDVGRVTGALSRRAEEVFSSLDEDDPAVAEQVFLRLVTVSDDADDVRRRVRRSELESLGFDAGALDRVVDAFGSARLITFDRDPITRGPTVEVAHEALLREWDRLRGWIEQRREALVLRRRFTASMEEWEAAGRSEGHLPSEGRLAQFEELAVNPSIHLASTERAFLDAAIGERDRRRAERRRRRRAILAGFAGAAVVALVLTGIAWTQRNTAEREAAIAQGRQLVFQSDGVLDFDPELAIHLLLEAGGLYRSADEAPDADLTTALHRAIAADRLVWRVPGGRLVDVHPDGNLIATSDGDDVVVWDRTTNEIVERYGRPGVSAERAIFSPDGRYLIVGFFQASPPITVFDRETGEEFTLGTGSVEFPTPEVEIGPDGELLVFEVHSPPSVQVWSISERRMLQMWQDTYAPAFTPSGELGIAACPSETCEVRVVDGESGEIDRRFPVGFLPIFMGFSPDGNRVVVGDQDQMTIIDSSTGAEIARPNVDRNARPTWLPSGEAFVSGGESIVRVIDASTGEVRNELLGQAGGSWDYRMIPGTNLVAVATLTTGSTALYDLSPGPMPELGGWQGPTTNLWGVGHVRDGSRIFVGSRRDSPYLTADALDGGNPQVFTGDDTVGDWMSRIYHGTWIAGPDEHAIWHVRRADDGAVTYSAPAGWTVRGVSNDGSKAVIHHDHLQAEDPEARPPIHLVATSDGSVIADLGQSAAPGHAWFTPDDSLFLLANLSAEVPSRIFSAETGQVVVDLVGADFHGIFYAFIPNEPKLLIGTLDGRILLADLDEMVSGVAPEEAVLRSIPAHDALILNLDVSPDGSMVASSSWNEPLRVWDLETGDLIAEFDNELVGQAKHSGAFHPTLPHIVVATPPDQIRIYTLDFDELVAIAESRLSREMTDDECRLYLQRACDG